MLRYSKLVINNHILVNYAKSNTGAARAGCCLQSRCTLPQPFVPGVVLSLQNTSACLTQGFGGQSSEQAEEAQQPARVPSHAVGRQLTPPAGLAG